MSGLLEEMTTTETIVLSAFMGLIVLIGANIALNTFPRFIELFRKKSPLKIVFVERFQKDIIDKGEPATFYYCEIHNQGKSSVKGVRIDCICENESHRKAFHDGNVTEKTVYRDNQERVDLVSYKIRKSRKKKIHVLTTGKYIKNIEFNKDYYFVIKICCEEYGSISETFVTSVVLEGETPRLKLQKLILSS
jgi:hypothetical protein